MKKMLLPDVNVWLALVFSTHVHHPSALAWIDSLSDEISCFCRVTQMGFLRLANNPKVFPNDAVSVTVAWQLYDTTRIDPRVSFALEPAGLESAWRQFTQGQRFSPKLWNDAYLAGFAQTGGYELVTFDKAIAQYPGVAVIVLS
jgi:toxin-antitoxin system PIN domain toxin